MIGIDTNVLVRFLTRDDESQFVRASRLIKSEADQDESVFVSLLVLLETEWVLRSRYGMNKAEMIEAVSKLLESKSLEIEDEASVEEALFTWRDRGVEFADCLIGAHHRRAGCRTTATFDARAAVLPDFVGL